jgi:signal transduction histidine kinase/ActR/RegA family two-component response regulator
MLLFSGAITVIITAIQLYAEYRKDVDEIDTFISRVEKSFVVPIASGLWHFDMQSVRLQLEGMLRFRDIEYLEITEEGNPIVSVGNPQTKHVFSKNIPLIYNYRNQDREIGKLTVVASLTGVYSRLFDRAITILISQGMKTFLVSGFILIIFYLLVTRHLSSISSYLKDLDLKSIPPTLKLNRRASTKRDELDQVVESTNEMTMNLHESYQTISTELELRKQAEERLVIAYKDIEKRVEERTAELTKTNEQLRQEITQRKRAEEALRNSKATLELAQKMAGLGYWSYNIETEMPTWSREMYVVFGADPEQGQPSYEDHKKTWHPDDWDMFDQAVQDAIQLGKTYNIVIRVIFPDHSIHYVNTQGYPRYDEDGKITELYGTSQDITERMQKEEERKQLQEKLQQSQKMEAVGTLAGGIAHDFNNILAVILGNAELAADDIPPGNPAGKSLKAIHQASIRAKDMVQQLLAFSRKSDEETKLLNMTPIIKESLKMLRSAVPTSIEFKQHISGDACNILGDAAQINQIMMNLVTNASHAMSEEGGLLDVTIEKMILQEETPCFDFILSPGPHIRLKVRDTGKGIPPKILARIFDPYYTTKEVGKGTGMGLSVVHGIVKSHGGGILVESTLGEGTVFEIYFPALEEMSEKEKEPEGEIKGGSERILFVDDEESMVNLNRERLERLGYQVKSTTRPLQALEWFSADPDGFDVIITDMTMPRMTGDRLTKEILTIRPQMPVIICTGYSERMSEKRAETLGVRKYIEKPIALRNLASALREVLDEK